MAEKYGLENLVTNKRLRDYWYWLWSIKSLVNLNRLIYFNKVKEKYFKLLGIDTTLDIEQKLARDIH